MQQVGDLPTSDSLAGVVVTVLDYRPLSASTPMWAFIAEVPLVALLGLVHLRVALASAFLVELGAAMIVASTMPLLEQQALALQMLVDRLRMSSAGRSPRADDGSSGSSSRGNRLALKLSPADERNDAISYSASSIAGSLNANQFCIR